MNPIEGLAYGFSVAVTPENLLAALIGALIGTVAGILPGLGPTSVIALLLVPTLGLPPETALIMLGGIYYGTQYGDSMLAILINVPSEAAAVVIGLDGHRMARNGRAGVALAIAAIGSWIGASVGLLGLIALAVPLADLAIQFGPPQFLVIGVVALVALARTSGAGTWRGLVSLGIGLALTTVGRDPLTSYIRYSFGYSGLNDGFEFIAIIIGIIGFSGMLQYATVTDLASRRPKIRFRELFPSFREFRDSIPAGVRGGVLGFLLGIVPGPGAVLSTFVSYNVERHLDARVGTGVPKAIAGPKAADDASVGGTLLPLMVLGVPFTGVTAVLFAGMLLHGVQPGPLLLTQHADIFWGLVVAMYIGNLALLVLNFPMVGLWVNILKIPRPILVSTMIALMLVGSYSLRDNVVDMITVVAGGVLGYVLLRFGFSRIVVILGLIIGPLIETSFRQGMAMSKGSLAVFFTGWINLVLWAALVVFLLAPPAIRLARRARRGRAELASEMDRT